MRRHIDRNIWSGWKSRAVSTFARQTVLMRGDGRQ